MSRNLAYNSRYALNAICPYFTMFPLEFPFKLLKKHKQSRPIVLDPFCGRGTTIYAAREMGFSSWGIDSSPIAVAIAKAKLATTRKEHVITLAEKLVAKEPKEIPQTAFFSNAYARETLKQLCALREGLMRLELETDTSILLRAAILGCLHGPLNKNIVNAAYFSNQMPRTFSTKPDYSVQYWKRKELFAPKVNVINVLDRKLSRILGLDTESVGKSMQIICADSRTKATYNKLPEDISLIITSPPYYGMRTYIQDQWLRLWFLGGPEDLYYTNGEQIAHNGQETFIKDLASVWENINKRSTSNDLHLYVRFGSIPSIKSDPKKILISSLEEAGGWDLISVRNASTAHAGNRQAEQMTRNSEAAVEYDFHAVRSC